MQRTKNKPTVPGWYWVSWKDTTPGAVEIFYDDEWLLAVSYHSLLPLLTDKQFNDCIFYGPITPPELPKE